MALRKMVQCHVELFGNAKHAERSSCGAAKLQQLALASPALERLLPAFAIVSGGGLDNTVRIWQASTGQLQQTLTEHTAWVYSVAWSPDGTQIVSGSGDETVRIWKQQE